MRVGDAVDGIIDDMGQGHIIRSSLVETWEMFDFHMEIKENYYYYFKMEIKPQIKLYIYAPPGS